MQDRYIIEALADRIERRQEEQRGYLMRADEADSPDVRHWLERLHEGHDDIIAEVWRVAADLGVKDRLHNELSNRRIDRWQNQNIIAGWK